MDFGMSVHCPCRVFILLTQNYKMHKENLAQEIEFVEFMKLKKNYI